MHANVVTLQYKSPEDADEAVRRMLSEVLPHVKKTPGFHRVQLARIGPTTTVHFGVFDTQANAEKARVDVAPLMLSAIQRHLAQPPRIESGEIQLSS